MSVDDAVISRQIPFATVERVNRVILWMTARSRDGSFLTDLTADEIRVREDGRLQEILGD